MTIVKLYEYKAWQLHEKLKNKEISALELVKEYLNRIDSLDDKIGAFLFVNREESIKRAEEVDEKISQGLDINILEGMPIGIKDNISVKGMQNSCASKIMTGYKAPYDAYVVEKLKEQGAIIIGKTNMDEFAMGSSNETSYFKKVKNPWDLDRVPGGSSGGSAAAVAAGEVALSLGTETGGSVRQPAAFCGLVGVKPTYGRVSRYGVTAFGSTLDQVGVFGKDVKDAAILTEAIAGFHMRDSTSIQKRVPQYIKNINKDLKGLKIGIPKEFFNKELNYGIRESIEHAIEIYIEKGAEIVPCEIPLIEYSLAVYYITSCAEASSNLSRFDGIRYGMRTSEYKDTADMYYKTRSEGFGKEVKRRIMLGTYVLSKGYYDEYYKKALKVRKMIKVEMEETFKKVDVLLTPTTPDTAFQLGEKNKTPMDMYLNDIYTVPANVIGLPAISIPCGFVHGLPVGMQLIGSYFREDMLFNTAYIYEQSNQWHNKVPNL